MKVNLIRKNTAGANQIVAFILGAKAIKVFLDFRTLKGTAMIE